MPTEKTSRLAAILWFVAAALAIVAFAIRAARGEELRWYLVAVAAAFLVLGIAAVRRRRL